MLDVFQFVRRFDSHAANFCPLSDIKERKRGIIERVLYRHLSSSGATSHKAQRLSLLFWRLNEEGGGVVRFKVSTPPPPLLPPSSSTFLPLSLSPSPSLHLSLPLSGGCHHGDSAVPMLQYEDQEGCSLSPMATAAIGCEHRVAHIKLPPPHSVCVYPSPAALSPLSSPPETSAQPANRTGIHAVAPGRDVYDGSRSA